ncbi:DUF3331 domain-containing protein [Paraburkholderia sp. GAS334]|uniref:DUF3331 domain-containing protein n=1 Tax=Paraburkholderia sp. GAS334 TaxID=3035131 RepID=UPI003D231553
MYGYQPWRLTHASVAGRCTLKGGSIRRGDEIYQPSRAQPKQTNLNAVILAPTMYWERKFISWQ